MVKPLTVHDVVNNDRLLRLANEFNIDYGDLMLFVRAIEQLQGLPSSNPADDLPVWKQYLNQEVAKEMDVFYNAFSEPKVSRGRNLIQDETAKVVQEQFRHAKEVLGDDYPSYYPRCGCRTCRPNKLGDMRMIVCRICGNKRCPHANNHENKCTNSNAPGQPGSAY